MTRHFKLVSGPLFGLLILVGVLPSTGCDAVEPTRLPVGDTITLYSLARAEYIGERSAFDFAGVQTVVVEQPNSTGFPRFDVAFSELDGEFVLIPAGVFESYEVEPGVATVEGVATFETLERAPDDGYVTEEAVPLTEGGLYAVRTRSSGACSQYAKVEVLELDPAGILEFRFLRNNLCNDRTLTEVD